MNVYIRTLKNDPSGVKLLARFDGEHQYRRRWFPSETHMNEAVIKSVFSVSAADLMDLTSEGLRLNATRDIEAPGRSDEWVRLFKEHADSLRVDLGRLPRF
jgi:hypothetical protein